MSLEIQHGHVLSVLQGMESESVQCVICSPPYYGLRSYQTEPQVWGNHNGCSHEWGNNLDPKKLRGTLTNIDNSKEVFNKTESDIHLPAGHFCLSCNAWRGELGLEPTFQLYISHLIEIFAEVKRVLKKDGTCFVNLGDSYGTQSGNAKDIANGKNITYGDLQYHAEIAPTNKPNGYHKSLLNIPARFAIAMTDELKMIQRNEIIWYKRACMPSSAKDRFTVDFEKIFFFAKEPRYKFNQQLEPAESAGRLSEGFQTSARGQGISPSGNGVPGVMYQTPENRNKRCVWDVPFEPSGNEHYASYPTKLVEPMILAGTDEGDTVLDIFSGTGTTLLTALRHRRKALGIELNDKYVEMSKRRLAEVQVQLF